MHDGKRTWHWGGDIWTQGKPAPSAAQTCALVCDTARNRVVGYDGENTWEWDGEKWCHAASDSSPPSGATAIALVSDGRIAIGGGWGIALIGPTEETQ